MVQPPTTPGATEADRLPEAKADEIAAVLRVIGNPNRLRMLYFLLEGEKSVGEIERGLGIRQPSLSQQLGELRGAALVSTRREHKVVFYSLTDQRTRAVLEALGVIFGAGASGRARPSLRPESRPRNAEAACFAVVGDGS